MKERKRYGKIVLKVTNEFQREYQLCSSFWISKWRIIAIPLKMNNCQLKSLDGNHISTTNPSLWLNLNVLLCEFFSDIMFKYIFFGETELRYGSKFPFSSFWLNIGFLCAFSSAKIFWFWQRMKILHLKIV